MLINKGVDIYTISQMVGHADTKTTINTYGDLYPDKRTYITSLFVIFFFPTLALKIVDL